MKPSIRTNIGLIACCSRKLKGEYKAKDIYISDLFKYSKKYCEIHCLDYYILSAKYGLLNKNDIISDYNLTLNTMNKEEKIIWSEKIKKSLLFLKDNNLIILAGKNYYQYWLDKNIFPNYSLIFSNFKGIGYILQYLKNQICQEKDKLSLF